MKTFNSITDVEQIRDTDLYTTIKDPVVPDIAATPDYRPEDDGYHVFIEPGDVDHVLSDLHMPWRLSEVPFEAVIVIAGAHMPEASKPWHIPSLTV